jgi:hypothetical protein
MKAVMSLDKELAVGVMNDGGGGCNLFVMSRRIIVETTPQKAVDLGSFTGTRIRKDLTIDTTEDVDWYKFTTERTGTKGCKVRIEFTNSEGDLALALYASDGVTLIRQVDGVGNSEEISLTGLAQGTYYLKVLSNHKDVSRGYKLTLVL